METYGYETRFNEVTLKVGDKINGHTIKQISKFKFTPNQIDIFTDHEIIEACGDRSLEVFRVNKIEELLKEWR